MTTEEKENLDELSLSHSQLPLAIETSFMDGTTTMTESTVEPIEHKMPEPPARASSTSDAAFVAVIIGRNTPTRRSILITPQRASSLTPSPGASSRTSSSTTTSSLLPPHPEGTECITPSTTRTNSFDSLKEDSTCGSLDPTVQLPSESGHESLPEQRLNVKFAPLPDMGPRKRRGMPLGVAARSRMVRRRRGGPQQQQQQVAATPMWTEEELQEQRQRLATAWEKQRENRDYYGNENGEPIEDPITILGRMVKVAGKQLWKKVASREGKEKEKDAVAKKTSLEKIQRDSEDVPANRSSSSPPQSEVDRVSSSMDEGQPDDAKKNNLSWEQVGEREALPPPPQGRPEEETTTRKRFVWSRLRTESKSKEPSSSPGAKFSSKGVPVRSFSVRKSESSPQVEAGNEEHFVMGLRRSMSV